MAGISRPAVFGPLARDGLVDRVADLLSDAIIAGRIGPGERLSESTIARDLGVSRAPVREAARLLENSGLVRYHPNRGFFVHEIDADSMLHIYELRLAVEIAAAERLVTQGLVAITLPALRARMEGLREAARRDGEVVGMIDADMAFHRAICVASGNPRFVQVFDQLANETKLGLMLIGRLYDDPALLVETHAPVLMAIASGDAAATTAALKYHIGTARDLVPTMMREAKLQRTQ